MQTVDYEEGEVEDASDSDKDVSLPSSGDEFSLKYDSANKSQVCRADSFGLSSRKKHSRHSSIKLQEKSKDHVTPVKLAGPHGRNNASKDGHAYSKRLRSTQSHPSLLECVSDEEVVDLHVLNRVEADQVCVYETKRKKKKRKRDTSRSNNHSRPKSFNKSDNCPRTDAVSAKRQELCKFYAVGVCSKESSCHYLHSEFPCKFYHLSDDCHHGDKCKFSHAPLTPSTRILLEKISSVKTLAERNSNKSNSNRTSDSSRLSSCGLVEPNDHGDMDYRIVHQNMHHNPTFDHEPPNHNFGLSRMPTPNLFAPVFPGNRQFSPDSEFMYSRNVRPFVPGDQMTRSHYPGDGPHPRHFPPRMGNPYMASNYPPQPPGIGSLPPMAGPTAVNGFRGIPSPDTIRCQMPRMIGPRMRMIDSAPSRFPHFRPPRFDAFCPRARMPSRPFDPSIKDHEEAIVSSELDKMAALLASSKPQTGKEGKNKSPFLDPLPQSPNFISKTDSQNSSFEEIRSPRLTPKTEANILSPDRPHNDQITPDLNTFVQPTNYSQGPTPWRLVPLDMSVKIPYPLMQLPVDELPHRFDDPRLRGQLTTLRPQHTLKSSMDNEIESLASNGLTETEPLIITDATRSEEPNNNTSDVTTQRRPVKFQLNEMANTFASTTPYDATNISNRQGDRSYLDDPRFRRRRILTNSTTIAPKTLADSSEIQPGESHLDSKIAYQDELTGI